MFAARIRVRSVRSFSASGCTPTAFSKSIPMFHLVVDCLPARARTLGAALLFVGGIAHAASAGADVDARVLAAARAVLAQQAGRAGLVDPLFEATLAHGGRPAPSLAQEPAVEGVDTRHPARMRFAAVCAGDAGWRQEFVV